MEEIRSPSTLYDLAAIHDRYAITDGCDGEKIVRDVEDAHAQLPIQAGKQLQNLRLRDEVKSACGLVCDEQRRQMQNGHGDEYPAAPGRH